MGMVRLGRARLRPSQRSRRFSAAAVAAVVVLVGLVGTPGSAESPSVVAATINVGDSPVGVAISPDGGTAYVANSGSDSVSIIDTASNSVAATVATGIRPVGLAVSPDGSSVYVANAGSQSVSVIDASSGTLVQIIPLGDVPWSVAITPDGSSAWVATSPPVGPPSRFYVYVIDTGSLQVTQSVLAGMSSPSDGVALAISGSMAYVTSPGTGGVEVIDTITATTRGVGIPIGMKPTGVATGLRYGYVTSSDNDTATVVDTSTQTVTQSVTVGPRPSGVAVTPDGSTVYVANSGGSSVSVLDTSDNSVADTVTVGADPTGVAVAPSGDAVYVTNRGDGTVSVLVPPDRTVTFDANGGSGSMAAQSGKSPASLDTNTFTRTGFTFAGWNTAADGSGTAYDDGEVYDFADSVTLYAQWLQVPPAPPSAPPASAPSTGPDQPASSQPASSPPPTGRTPTTRPRTQLTIKYAVGKRQRLRVGRNVRLVKAVVGSPAAQSQVSPTGMAEPRSSSVIRVRTGCYLEGMRLTGRDRRTNCGITTRTTDRTAVVRARPRCAADLSIRTRIVAKSPGARAATWTRQWRMQKMPDVVCSLNGTG